MISRAMWRLLVVVAMVVPLVVPMGRPMPASAVRVPIVVTPPDVPADTTRPVVIGGDVISLAALYFQT